MIFENLIDDFWNGFYHNLIPNTPYEEEKDISIASLTAFPLCWKCIFQLVHILWEILKKIGQQFFSQISSPLPGYFETIGVTKNRSLEPQFNKEKGSFIDIKSVLQHSIKKILCGITAGYPTYFYYFSFDLIYLSIAPAILEYLIFVWIWCLGRIGQF